jgi:hypothetical protein
MLLEISVLAVLLCDVPGHPGQNFLHRETSINMLINSQSTDNTRCFCAFTMDGDPENYGGPPT